MTKDLDMDEKKELLATTLLVNELLSGAKFVSPHWVPLALIIVAAQNFVEANIPLDVMVEMVSHYYARFAKDKPADEHTDDLASMKPITDAIN